MKFVAAIAGTLALPVMADAQSQIPQPAHLHQCVHTKISELGSRLEGQPDSGSAVAYESGVTGVSYDTVRAIQMSRVGDPVIVCLTSIPKGCPKGDDRGKTYSAGTNAPAASGNCQIPSTSAAEPDRREPPRARFDSFARADVAPPGAAGIVRD